MLRDAFNVSYRKVGGLHFVKLGRITLMWCVSKPKVERIPVERYRLSSDGVLVLGYTDERYHDA